MEDRPKLRPIEAFAVEHEGRRVLALRDPSGYSPSLLLLPAETVEIVAKFDGEHTIVDIQSELMRSHGELVFRHLIEEVVETLDEHGFLDSQRFAHRRESIDREFLESSSRPPSHAGGAYSRDPGELRATMDRFFAPPAGPGPIAWSSPSRHGETGSPPEPSHARVEGIIAPHIDFHRGGPAYAWAYRDLAERSHADLFVIFGTCHAGMRDPIAMTRKSYDTPLGAAEVDRDVVDALAARARFDCFASEPAHRNEHSIEFQAVFLRYLYADRHDFTIVPILTSFAHEAMVGGRAPENDPKIVKFFDALIETVQATGRRAAFVAGADLAHMGPRFGDAEAVSQPALARIAREDREMLRAVEEGDAKAFFASVAADHDRRRICGLSPIWSLLHVLAGRRGALRHYGQWPDPEAVVTYASVVFY